MFGKPWRPEKDTVAVPALVAEFCVDENILKARAFAFYCYLLARIEQSTEEPVYVFTIVPDEIETVTGNNWSKFKTYLYDELHGKGFVVICENPNTLKDQLVLRDPVPAIRAILKRLALTDKKYLTRLKAFQKAVKKRGIG